MTEVRNLLKTQKSENGVALQDHIIELVQKMQENENKTVPLEIISQYIKANSFNLAQQKSDAQVNQIKPKQSENHKYIQDSLNIINVQNVKTNSKVLTPDLYNDFDLLEQAGISFGKEQQYLIIQSIQKLIKQYQPLEIRFWGKFLTQNRDYYILEGISKDNHLADPLAKNCEVKGDGINMYTYWATQDILGEWIELPLISPEQLNEARQIKYILQGDLNKKINSQPAFNGKEKHFIKAQIVRISSGAVCVPSGLYKMKEEQKENEKNIEFDESYKYPEFGELKQLDKWVHKYCYVLKQGRCSHYIDPSLSEEVRDELKAKMEENDPDQVPRLQSISEDKGPYYKESVDDSDPTQWLIKETGDINQFKVGDNITQYGTVILRNITWKGALIAANQRGYLNFYIGYGLKTNQTPFLPLQPSQIETEIQDRMERPEPNPSKPIVEYIPEPPQAEDEEPKEEEQY